MIVRAIFLLYVTQESETKPGRAFILPLLCKLSLFDRYQLFHNFQAYLSREEAQATIAQILAEKDALRSQLVVMQESVFTLQVKRRSSVKQKVSKMTKTRQKHEHAETKLTVYFFIFEGEGREVAELSV